ncbi:GNAT family N-acetyltransferase [Alkalihalobacterium alkalinitrilicum]|uniref:GNAT family N-acetyltransferase n=1 Tax=Alkalihalobacterium alkalinitrilicum TaxID=427920 RepID=UPI001302F5BD|nr:GNAT family protein [Alkalihalobacterium alkalinitrilicum]
MNKYFITGKKVGLRELNVNDANEKYISWMNDREVTKFLDTGNFPTSQDDLTRYITTINKGTDIFLGIFDRLSQQEEHIGNIKLSNINWIHRTAELGIMIGDKSYWGKGYGSEATSLLVDFGFRTLNIRKIYLGVFANHKSAIKAYEKVGFNIDGNMKKHLYLDGNYVDKTWMSIFNNNISN